MRGAFVIVAAAAVTSDPAKEEDADNEGIDHEVDEAFRNGD